MIWLYCKGLIVFTSLSFSDKNNQLLNAVAFPICKIKTIKKPKIIGFLIIVIGFLF